MVRVEEASWASGVWVLEWSRVEDQFRVSTFRV